jgi:LacI family transcriptional regulator
MHSVTIRDVALHAGVSVRTVSRVVNGRGEITEATRLRVQTAIDELGFQPNKLARALVTQHTDTIGLIVDDIANPFFAELAASVQANAQAAGYSIFLCHSAGLWEEELRALDSLVAHGVDGIILYPSAGLTAERLSPFADRYGPIVTIGHAPTNERIGRVRIAIRGGAYEAVEHLIARGHRCIAMLCGIGAPAIHHRYHGYREALLCHDLPVRDELVWPGATTFERGRASTLTLLAQYPDITAIFAYNDLLALGALRACSELGRRVPADCAVVGFDDILLADWVSPSLTTVRVDKVELGSRAVGLLLDMLHAPESAPPSVTVDTRLVVRESA